MKEIWTNDSSKISFYAINVDPTDTFIRLKDFEERQDYPWEIAQPGEGMLASLHITSQSTKIAIAADGVITYRDGYGKGTDDTWRKVFKELSVE